MSGHELPGLADRLVGAAIKLLAAVCGLYLAASLLQSILPFLLFLLGIGGLAWVTVVVIRTLRERW
ncbi:hypothetical protein [Nocardia caishijiensis]|uniref:Uncharacterized protein n=1 Tax=Nocardia caishijiensis TaxID=184756 RepID=A0ABQ6YE69_9NOCA|nr:hypothetical protein [Nocardia caishijiensis]KAF0835700.1 hypothetical protein FNL39_1192 [Nocardia caishijiensis]